MARRFSSKNKVKEKKEKQIDLGFSKLISSLNEASGPQATIAPPARNDTPSIPKESVAGGEGTVGREVAEKGDASILSTQSPTTVPPRPQVTSDSPPLTTSGGPAEDSVQTIAWIRHQFDSRKVPPSILAAPLESASSNIEKYRGLKSASIIRPELSDPRFIAEVATLLLDVASKLITTLSDGFAIPFIERAIALDPTSKDRGSSLLVKERERLKKLSGRKALKEKRLNSIEAALLNLESNRGDQNKANGAPDIIESTQESEPLRANGRIIVIAAILGILIGLFLFGVEGTNSLFNLFGRSGYRPTSPVEAPVVAPTLEIPDQERVKNISGLDAILYGIDSSPQRPVIESGGGEGDIVAGLPKPSSDTNRGLESASPTSPTMEVPQPTFKDLTPRKSGKEQVDTTGPVEGTIFCPELKRPENRDDRKLFPESRDRGDQRSEKFGAGKVYRVISKTRVMSSPSYFAVTLGVVDMGARVEVIERQGEWLKLKSRMGQSGYILAQDAEPAG